MTYILQMGVGIEFFNIERDPSDVMVSTINDKRRPPDSVAWPAYDTVCGNPDDRRKVYPTGPLLDSIASLRKETSRHPSHRRNSAWTPFRQSVVRRRFIALHSVAFNSFNNINFYTTKANRTTVSDGNRPPIGIDSHRPRGSRGTSIATLPENLPNFRA